jgi:hypothetical protein
MLQQRNSLSRWEAADAAGESCTQDVFVDVWGPAGPGKEFTTTSCMPGSMLLLPVINMLYRYWVAASRAMLV